MQETFEIAVDASKKPPTYTREDEHIQSKFSQKELIKVI